MKRSKRWGSEWTREKKEEEGYPGPTRGLTTPNALTSKKARKWQSSDFEMRQQRDCTLFLDLAKMSSLSNPRKPRLSCDEKSNNVLNCFDWACEYDRWTDDKWMQNKIAIPHVVLEYTVSHDEKLLINRPKLCSAQFWPAAACPYWECDMTHVNHAHDQIDSLIKPMDY